MPDDVAGAVQHVSKQEMQAVREESGIRSIPIGKSETQIATEYRDRAIALLTLMVDLINEARRDGMQIAFQIGPPDGFNRQSLVMLEITKKLC